MAYFESLHEVKLIVDLIYEGGIANMRYSISNTAEYGDMTRGKRIITDATKAEMKKILAEIQSGEVRQEWIVENQAGRPRVRPPRGVRREHPIEAVGSAAALDDAVDRGGQGQPPGRHRRLTGTRRGAPRAGKPCTGSGRGRRCHRRLPPRDVPDGGHRHPAGDSWRGRHPDGRERGNPGGSNTAQVVGKKRGVVRDAR